MDLGNSLPFRHASSAGMGHLALSLERVEWGEIIFRDKRHHPPFLRGFEPAERISSLSDKSRTLIVLKP